MFKKATHLAARGALLAVLLLGSGAGSALAATVPAADVGTHLGTLLTGLGKSILIPAAGLFGLAAFVKRDVGHAVTIVVIASIVGIFIYDQAGAKSLIDSIASGITGK
jgi:hypothetical protein